MKNVKSNSIVTVLLIGIFSGMFQNLNATFGKDKATLSSKQIIFEEKPSNHFVKIALLLDTSNSMDGLINQAKAQLWDIVNEFTHARCQDYERPNLQIALYEYGNDKLSSREGYIRQVLAFSSDLDEISEKLFSLSTNGGEEYCGTVINSSLRQLDWGKNPDDLKLIFIAGNEPFDQGGLDYRDATAQAKEKDIVVNTIFCGHYDQGIASYWKDGAKRTDGDYMAIDHNREIVHIETPYDDIIIKLNAKLNATYVAFGNRGEKSRMNQVLQDSNALEMEADVAVKRAVSKSSKIYNNATWDLVDALEGKTLGVDIKYDELPKSLQGKSKAEVMKYVAGKKAERISLQKQIQQTNAQRDAFITKTQQHQEATLENAMIEAIKKQASRKSYIWE